MFNYNHLYYFYVTAKLKGVTTAARQLNTSQPSLSAQIKSLESRLGRKLFRKNGRKIELTEEGLRVYSYCRQMFEVADDLESYIKGIDENKRLKISIGVSQEIERPFIANVIGTAVKRNHEAKPVVSMVSETEEELRKSLRFHKIDFLISGSPVYDNDLGVDATYKMPVVFFLAPSLAEELKIKPKESLAETLRKAADHLALPSSSHRLRSEIDLFLQKRRVKFNLVFESDILASIIRAVSDGMAAGFLPLPYILKEARQGLVTIISPPEGLWQHSIYVVSKENLPRTPFQESLMEVMRYPLLFPEAPR